MCDSRYKYNTNFNLQYHIGERTTKIRLELPEGQRYVSRTKNIISFLLLMTFFLISNDNPFHTNPKEKQQKIGFCFNWIVVFYRRFCDGYVFFIDLFVYFTYFRFFFLI